MQFYKSVTLRELEWISVLLPLAFLGTYYYLMLGPLHELFHSWNGFLVLWLLLAPVVFVFARTVFRAFGAMQAEIAELGSQAQRYNRQLVELHRANLTLSHETRVDQALQAVVDLSAELVDARYAALAVFDDEGRVEEFFTQGVDDATAHRIGQLPEGRGLLGEVMRDGGQTLHLDDLSTHPERAGFPDGHPAMTRLLGAPVVHRGQTVGALYCAGGPERAPFTDTEKEIVSMFATHAAVVIQNARLYDDVQALAVERERQHIAWEMHDGLAQVLGFVNTKGQAAQEFLRQGNLAEARLQMSELVEAARKIYTDVREGIVALRTQPGGADSLRSVIEQYVREFEHFARVPVEVRWEVEESRLHLTPVIEVQLLRIMQEALTNARRHARAQRIEVALRADGDALQLTIEDDGVGFDPQHPLRGEWPQLGLKAMGERAEAIGASLSIESHLGEGTLVTVSVPEVIRAERAPSVRVG